MHQVAKLVYLCLQCFLNQCKTSFDVVLMAQVSGGDGADQGKHRARLVLLIASPAFSPKLSHQFLSNQISTKNHLLLACAGYTDREQCAIYMQRLIAAFSTQYDYAYLLFGSNGGLVGQTVSEDLEQVLQQHSVNAD